MEGRGHSNSCGQSVQNTLARMKIVRHWLIFPGCSSCRCCRFQSVLNWAPRHRQSGLALAAPRPTVLCTPGQARGRTAVAARFAILCSFILSSPFLLPLPSPPPHPPAARCRADPLCRSHSGSRSGPALARQSPRSSHTFDSSVGRAVDCRGISSGHP